ncbi:MAG: MGMT family protein [Caldilineaceae bacterium]
MMTRSVPDYEPTYLRIYAVVRQIPLGKVATYGQIAAIVGNCTARMVGYAMAALPGNSDVPWQRVINAQGKISPRSDSSGTEQQRLLLREEGIAFKANGATNLRLYRWPGPPLTWLLEHGYEPMPEWKED